MECSLEITGEWEGCKIITGEEKSISSLASLCNEKCERWALTWLSIETKQKKSYISLIRITLLKSHQNKQQFEIHFFIPINIVSTPFTVRKQKSWYEFLTLSALEKTVPQSLSVLHWNPLSINVWKITAFSCNVHWYRRCLVDFWCNGYSHLCDKVPILLWMTLLSSESILSSHIAWKNCHKTVWYDVNEFRSYW